MPQTQPQRPGSKLQARVMWNWESKTPLNLLSPRGRQTWQLDRQVCIGLPGKGRTLLERLRSAKSRVQAAVHRPTCRKGSQEHHPRMLGRPSLHLNDIEQLLFSANQHLDAQQPWGNALSLSNRHPLRSSSCSLVPGSSYMSSSTRTKTLPSIPKTSHGLSSCCSVPGGICMPRSIGAG